MFTTNITACATSRNFNIPTFSPQIFTYFVRPLQQIVIISPNRNTRYGSILEKQHVYYETGSEILKTD